MSLFHDAIIATSQSLNILEAYIEKDYWVIAKVIYMQTYLIKFVTFMIFI